VVFASSRGRARPEESSLWTVAAAPGAEPPRRLTDDAGVDLGPRFSPDGRRLAFASTRAGGLDLYLLELDADGGAVGPPRRLTETPEPEHSPAFSPDGRALAYVSVGPAGARVAVLPLDGGPPRLVSPGPADAAPSFTGDGAAIVYSGASGRGDADPFTLPAAGGAATPLAPAPLTDERAPRVSADGRHVLATVVVRSGAEVVFSGIVAVDRDERPPRLRLLHPRTAPPRTGVDPAPVPLDAAALRRDPELAAAFAAFSTAVEED
jgi:Tol biopolymer transport system component